MHQGTLSLWGEKGVISVPVCINRVGKTCPKLGSDKNGKEYREGSSECWAQVTEML